jgi:hypothetical protein
MLQCDWCHKPIGPNGAKGWAFQLELAPFHSLSLGRKVSDEPKRVALETHLHAKPCKDELGWAIEELLKDREPLETDGPSDEDEAEVEESTDDATQERWRERIKRQAAWRRMPRDERE